MGLFVSAPPLEWVSKTSLHIKVKSLSWRQWILCFTSPTSLPPLSLTQNTSSPSPQAPWFLCHSAWSTKWQRSCAYTSLTTWQDAADVPYIRFMALLGWCKWSVSTEVPCLDHVVSNLNLDSVHMHNRKNRRPRPPANLLDLLPPGNEDLSF